MDKYLKAQLAVLALFLTMIAAAGCISWMSAEPQPDGSAVICARVEPTRAPDAGADSAAGTAGTASIAPTMRYVLVHPPVGVEKPQEPDAGATR
jgi:hypothetical protein